MKHLAILVLSVCLLGCEKPAAAPPGRPATRPVARLIVPAGKVQFAQKQRTTEGLPGSNGAVRLTVDDITRGQVMLSLSLADGQVLLATRSVSSGDVVQFALDDQTYQLTVDRLKDALIGEDAVSFTLTGAIPATRPAMTVAQQVEYLIDTIAKLDGATFIRNDGEYTAANAAALMRFRWERDKGKLKTAEQFVEELATKSSTTGKPYVIRFKDGNEIKSGEYLLKKLAEIRQ